MQSPTRTAATGPPLAATVGRFDVLPGDQRQQPNRLGCGWREFLLGQMHQQPMRITNQGVDQLFPGVRVVPGDSRLARLAVIMPGAPFGDHLRGAGDGAGHPADRRDQLGDRVLSGDRVEG